MTYNLTWSGTANTLGDIFVGINTNSGNWLGVMILFALWVLILMSFPGTEIKKVLLVDGFFVTVLGILMWGVGIFALAFVAVPVILLIVGILAYFLS